jgi:hypothetical protein
MCLDRHRLQHSCASNSGQYLLWPCLLGILSWLEHSRLLQCSMQYRNVRCVIKCPVLCCSTLTRRARCRKYQAYNNFVVGILGTIAVLCARIVQRVRTPGENPTPCPCVPVTSSLVILRSDVASLASIDAKGSSLV